MTARGSRGGGRGGPAMEPVGDYQPPGGLLFNLSGGVGRVQLQRRPRAGAIAPFIGAGVHQPMPEPNITPITRSPADNIFQDYGRTRPRGGGISRGGLLVCNITGIWTGRGPPPLHLLGFSQYGDGAPPPAQAPVQQPTLLVQQAPPLEPVQVQPASQVESGASGSAQPTSTASELAICARKIAQALNEFAEVLEKK